ncbi:response regulator [Aquincola sp. J276]|uniref:response regulator n=1 Tax=Aquincola sp. J276 TaxID=2898432 RepID=UPI002151850E|nr:response regulator [Aquincola sp. J276]MCR5864787.1 response regulator [Aquincola sp. J276]
MDVSPSLAAVTQTLSGDLSRLTQRVKLLGEQALAPATPSGSLILRIEQQPAGPLAPDDIVLRFGFHDPALRSAAQATHFFDERFRRAATATSPPPLQPLDAALRPLQQHQILAVDDNAPALRVLLQTASAFGLSIEPAHDGWDALRAVMLAHEASRDHGLVLLDARMPGMDALDCARQLRENTPCRAPILLMAGPGDEDAVAVLAPDQPLGRALGIAGVLRKPVVDGAVLARACLDALVVRPPLVGPEPAAPGPLDGLHLLVVADTDVATAGVPRPATAALVAQLRLAGASARQASGGGDTLDLLAMPQCDAVLLHLQPPGGRALEAARALRAEPRLRHLPLLAVGPEASQIDRARLQAAGIDEALPDAGDMQALATALARCRAARAAATPAALQPLDSLPGIDAAIGRASTMGNDKLYRRLLIKFRDAQHDVPARIADAWQASDVQGARRLAHDLASVSGTLGAMQLHRCARDLESVCAGEADAARLPALLAATSVELSRVVRSLQLLGTE